MADLGALGALKTRYSPISRMKMKINIPRGILVRSKQKSLAMHTDRKIIVM